MGLVGVVCAQYEAYDYGFGSDYDYADLQKFGSMVPNTPPESHTPYGHGRNRRYCHTTGHNRMIYRWNSSQQGGYFYEGRNIMECLGDELYCFIEERAQFGQVLSITAGCEKMTQSSYGLGGCVSVAAQHGQKAFDQSKVCFFNRKRSYMTFN